MTLFLFSFSEKIRLYHNDHLQCIVIFSFYLNLRLNIYGTLKDGAIARVNS